MIRRREYFLQKHNLNLNKLLCGWWQTDSEIYIKRQNTQVIANAIFKKKNKVKGLTLFK